MIGLEWGGRELACRPWCYWYVHTHPPTLTHAQISLIFIHIYKPVNLQTCKKKPWVHTEHLQFVPSTAPPPSSCQPPVPCWIVFSAGEWAVISSSVTHLFHPWYRGSRLRIADPHTRKKALCLEFSICLQYFVFKRGCVEYCVQVCFSVVILFFQK